MFQEIMPLCLLLYPMRHPVNTASVTVPSSLRTPSIDDTERPHNMNDTHKPPPVVADSATSSTTVERIDEPYSYLMMARSRCGLAADELKQLMIATRSTTDDETQERFQDLFARATKLASDIDNVYGVVTKNPAYSVDAKQSLKGVPGGGELKPPE